MSAAGTSAIAMHVDAAKRLLRELEEQAETALNALGKDDGEEFLAAVAERDQTLAKFDHVVEGLAHEHTVGGVSADEDAEARRLVAEMARAASTALVSHKHLTAQALRERDRLAAALERTARPDPIANQYAATSPHPRAFSVTG
jgi:hypothetical protein